MACAPPAYLQWNFDIFGPNPQILALKNSPKSALLIENFQTKPLPFYGSRETEMERNSRVRDWFTFNDLLVSVSHAPFPATCTSNYLQLMTAHPEARLGYHSTEDVKKHPFFMEIDFDAVLNGQMRPPYVPLMVAFLSIFPTKKSANFPESWPKPAIFPESSGCSSGHVFIVSVLHKLIPPSWFDRLISRFR